MRYPVRGSLYLRSLYLRLIFLAIGAIPFAGGAILTAQAPVAGQNVNMVSGTQWPGGDPFLQRQNEPSLAVSSRNSLHLLAGANDYRTVDLPVSDTVPGSLAGDAWLGVFKSFDGGLTWQSYLLPGYPQDKSPEGTASPLKSFSAAADPTVRASTSGLFYFSGIAFNRGTNNGGVFVSTFLDANQKENGDATQGRDTIKYLNTVLVDSGTSGQFLDKPWIAVDIPRAGAATCTFNPLGTPQAFPAGNVYLVWSRFTGSTSTKIMFSRSQDCGKTWSTPTKLSESNSINQGTNVAIDPATGSIYVAWRRFATSSQTDAIMVAKSTDFGKTFASKNTVQVASIAPFDQSTTPTRFRTNALPSLAASVAGGSSYVHVAWAQRDPATGDARIVVSTSSDGGATWSNPVQVDSAPIKDDNGVLFTRGHQFMPQFTFAAGRLMLLYYDQRLDHTLGIFMPTQGFPDAQGRFYLRTQALKGELTAVGGQAQVFTLGLDDATLTARRHTIDLRVARALPGPAPAFASASVSQYRTGLWAAGPDGIFRDDEDQPIPIDPNTNEPASLYQLQVNAPNLPMFSLGTVPFMGDYIDIAGQTFVANGDGSWSFNTSPSSTPVFYATWTDNRDVVPPIDPSTGLVDWTKYTPPISATNAGDGTSTSILDPTQKVPACQSAFAGSRNQNVYSSRITEGLLVGSPQDAKPLSPVLQRAFVVTMQNLTGEDRTFTMTLTPGASVQASFLQTSQASVLVVAIPAHGGAARPVFATSTIAAGKIVVNVVESGANSVNLSGSVVLNPEGSVSPLVQPDGSVVNIGGVEVYTPSFQVWNTQNTNPFLNIGNPNLNVSATATVVSNADPAILNIGNLNIGNLNIGNLNIGNVSPAVLNIGNLNIGNTTAANLNIGNLNIGNLNIGNLNIGNLNIGNSPVSDATYAITNLGNTTHSYKVALYGNNPNHAPLQLIVTKNSTAPTAIGCSLYGVPQGIVLARADNPPIATSIGDATNPDIPGASNATIPLGPGETVFVTLRGATDQMAQLVRSLTPVVTAHGANTGGGASDFAMLLFIQTTGGALPGGAVVGTSYSTTLTALGGKGPLTWTLVSPLPPGLTLSPGGTISGTPTASGAFAFTVKVTDSSSPTPQSATQDFQLSVAARQTTTSVSFGANPIVVGQTTSVTATVSDTQASGTKSFPTGTVTLTGDPALSAGNCVLAPTATAGVSTCAVSITPTSPGPRTIQASYPGSTVHQQSGGGNQLNVNKAGTGETLTSSLNPSIVGQSVTFTASLAVTAPGAGSPTGSITFLDGATVLGATPLSSGSAAFTTSALAAGVHPVTASYPGDGNFLSSVSPALQQVVNPPPVFTFTGFLSPLTTAGTLANPSFSGSQNLGSAVPLKYQLNTSTGQLVTDISSTVSIKAVRNMACSGAPTGAEILLYSPTVGATGGSTFRFSSPIFIFNWDSSVVVPTGPACYTIVLQLSDGTAPKATTVQLR
jgi:hypothetical protein